MRRTIDPEIKAILDQPRSRLQIARRAVFLFCDKMACKGLYQDIMQDGDDTLPSWATAAERAELDGLMAELKAARMEPCHAS